MKKEDAIKELELIAKVTMWNDRREAVEMAIEALNKQDDDSISRQDAIEVVRCDECKHMIADGRCMEFADDRIRPSAIDFCSYGERKGGGDEWAEEYTN